MARRQSYICPIGCKGGGAAQPGGVVEGLHWTAQGSVRGLLGLGVEMLRLGGRFVSRMEGMRLGNGRWARAGLGGPFMRVGG